MISVIIITYHNERDIGECLTAVAQVRDSFEIILVDNDSQDMTRSYAETFREAHPEIACRFIWNPINRGYAAAVNQGLEAATGDRICILGPDTSVFPDTFTHLKKTLENDPKIGIAAPQLLTIKGEIQPSCRRFPNPADALLELTGLPRLFPKLKSRWKMSGFDHKQTMDVDQPEATCLLLRREVIETVGGMDEQFPLFFNDVDWCKRIRAKGWRIVFEPSAKVIHKKGTSVNRNIPDKVIKSHKGFYRYLMKHARTPGERFFIRLLGPLFCITGMIRIICPIIVKPFKTR